MAQYLPGCRKNGQLPLNCYQNSNLPQPQLAAVSKTLHQPVLYATNTCITARTKLPAKSTNKLNVHMDRKQPGSPRTQQTRTSVATPNSDCTVLPSGGSSVRSPPSLTAQDTHCTAPPAKHQHMLAPTVHACACSCHHPTQPTTDTNKHSKHDHQHACCSSVTCRWYMDCTDKP